MRICMVRVSPGKTALRSTPSRMAVVSVSDERVMARSVLPGVVLVSGGICGCRITTESLAKLFGPGNSLRVVIEAEKICSSESGDRLSGMITRRDSESSLCTARGARRQRRRESACTGKREESTAAIGQAGRTSRVRLSAENSPLLRQRRKSPTVSPGMVAGCCAASKKTLLSADACKVRLRSGPGTK